MANSNFKAADLIGKELIVGNGTAKYIINSVEGDTWMCTFQRKDAKDLVLPMKAASLLKMVGTGKVKWAEEPTATDTTNDKPTEAEAEGELDDVEEVEAEEIEEPKPAKPAKPKLRVVTGKIAKEKVREHPIEDEPTEPIEDEEEPETETEPEEKEVEETPKPKAKARKRAKGKYVYSVYITHRGKPGAQIKGFSPDEEVYLRARDMHALASRERVNGKRLYSLVFGPNFADAARQMCDALNEGAGVDELLEIVDANYKSLEQKWADKKAEYAEKKAKREEERKAAKTAKAAAKGAKDKGEELFTEAQVKERIRNAFSLLAKAIGCKMEDLEPIIKVA